MTQTKVTTRSAHLLQARERLLVGRQFLMLRPQIAALGALSQAVCLASSPVRREQSLLLAGAVGLTVLGFFGERLWLKRHALSERWLLTSLLLTLLMLSGGVTLSGGLASPMLPLLFAPIVIAFAAFARVRTAALFFGVAMVMLSLVAWRAPLPMFPRPPEPWATAMVWISTLMSLALLGVGVIGLVQAHERVAEALDRMRTDMLLEVERRAQGMEHFGAQMAHEVKNPLTAVRGLVQLVQRKTEDSRDQERLAVVVREVDRALDALKAYLSFARPLSDLMLSDVALRALLLDVAGVIEARAHEHAVNVSVIGDEHGVLADRQRVRDAVLNLALNALTAMPNGGQLTLTLRAPNDRDVLIDIADNGVGMDAALLARLGDVFTSESSDGSGASGTGLGVHIARASIAQHGGTLRFESNVNVGTHALITLPRHAAPTNAARTTMEPTS